MREIIIAGETVAVGVLLHQVDVLLQELNDLLQKTL
jgi:hypothetical protein